LIRNLLDEFERPTNTVGLERRMRVYISFILACGHTISTESEEFAYELFARMKAGGLGMPLFCVLFV
jgi:hypothetical protein